MLSSVSAPAITAAPTLQRFTPVVSNRTTATTAMNICACPSRNRRTARLRSGDAGKMTIFTYIRVRECTRPKKLRAAAVAALGVLQPLCIPRQLRHILETVCKAIEQVFVERPACLGDAVINPQPLLA